MTRIYCLITVFLISLTAKAQFTVPLYNDINGLPLSVIRYENVVGSPYLFEDFKPGKVILASGKAYEGLVLQYDQVADQLIFKYQQEQPQHFVEQATEFWLLDTLNGEHLHFKNGFPPVDKFTSASYYQVLSTGKASLLRKHEKYI